MTTARDESFAWCRSLARRSAGNFYYSFLTLPADQQRDMCALYAFMRVSDDIGDCEDQPIEERRTRLDEWRVCLGRALEGDTGDHPLFPALAEIVSRHEIPHEHLFAVLDGVRMDLEGNHIETFDDLARYCYHVAGAVGLCCIHVWGFHDERATQAAVDCGLAFQLTNILRDLGEDAEAGRVYLPREDFERFGYPPEQLVLGVRNDAFLDLMRFEVERARSYYVRAQRLFDLLEPAGKPILSAMLRIYGGLLDTIERRNYDVFSRRITLPRWRKLLISFDTIVTRRWFATRREGTRD